MDTSSPSGTFSKPRCIRSVGHLGWQIDADNKLLVLKSDPDVDARNLLMAKTLSEVHEKGNVVELVANVAICVSISEDESGKV